ncbi:hypothetical protein [Ornithinibacillus sp. 179-J 7C1 HS]|uniref:hypothetical protein n=1 Tax=Ornithinibacillus sp. 179-J 7C1 HS TaxID=3142384 RepID=UPI0039A15106
MFDKIKKQLKNIARGSSARRHRYYGGSSGHRKHGYHHHSGSSKRHKYNPMSGSKRYKRKSWGSSS